jgi:HAMP domain-containing protein
MKLSLKIPLAFAAAHGSMGEGYRKGFAAFKSADFDPTVGDKAVAGVDREPSALLEQAAKNIAVDSAQVAAKAAIGARHASEISVALMLAVLALAMIGGFLFSRTVSRPLGRALGCARAAATGDLSMDFGTSGKDEIAQLLVALKDMQSSLSQVVAKVRQNAEGVATASAEIASGNLNLSSRTEEQTASLEETAASMEELTTTVRQNAENARQASTLADAASHTASRGGDVMWQMVETMHGIADSSNKVAEIIAVIDGIAFQTNILAAQCCRGSGACRRRRARFRRGRRRSPHARATQRDGSEGDQGIDRAVHRSRGCRLGARRRRGADHCGNREIGSALDEYRRGDFVGVAGTEHGYRAGEYRRRAHGRGNAAERGARGGSVCRRPRACRAGQFVARRSGGVQAARRGNTV